MNGDRRGKPCKCSQCGIVEICTPAFDFYTAEPGGPLICETCFAKIAMAEVETVRLVEATVTPPTKKGRR